MGAFRFVKIPMRANDRTRPARALPTETDVMDLRAPGLDSLLLPLAPLVVRSALHGRMRLIGVVPPGPGKPGKLRRS